MRKNLFFCTIILLVFSFLSCASMIKLKDPIVIKNGDLSSFQYVIVNDTETSISGSGAGYNGIYSSHTKTVTPKEIIIGYLAKNGFVILNSIDLKKTDKTLIVNYGESGRREIFGGYTTEITIQFLNYETSEIIATTTAEGVGSTEVDDIKIAINRALTALFEN